MSFSVTQLRKQTRTVDQVQVGEEAENTISVEYRPAEITPALEAKLSDLQEDPQRGRTFVEQFSKLMARWDLMDGDGDDAVPYPLDPDSLFTLGYGPLLRVLEYVMDDFQPSKRGGKAAAPVAAKRR